MNHDFYEVNDKPVWDSNLGGWIEPDEVLEDKTPVDPNQNKGTDGAPNHFYGMFCECEECK